MKRIERIIIILFLLFLSACSKKEYVYFDFSCNNTELYKCELKNNKLNCDIKYPTCENKEFLGWYEANNYEDELDLYGTFIKGTIIYARWKDIESTEEFSSIVEEESSLIEEESSIVEELSSIEILSSYLEEPSYILEKTYTLSFKANKGTGAPSSSRVTYNSVLPSINIKPTREGYTFMGWYDNPDYTKGVKYYNDLNNAVKRYDKKLNITLYAGWKENILSIMYNGNSATSWNPVKNTYSVNVDGTVIFKDTKKVYEKKLKYDDKLDSTGLIDYNGGWFNWTKEGYIVEKGKEYYIENGTQKRELDQNKVYTAKELASYAGCDLSKTDCTITVKVNWKKNDYSVVNYSNFHWKFYTVNSGPITKYTSKKVYSYAIWAPNNVSDLNGISLPVIVWLHGAGEQGSGGASDESKLLNSGLLQVMSKWNTYKLDTVPAIIVAPQSPSYWGTVDINYDTIKALLAYTEDVYHTDPTKRVLMGHSIGGRGVVHLAYKHRDLNLYAAVPLSGGDLRYGSDQKTIVVGEDGKEFFSKLKIRGYGETPYPQNFFNWIGKPNEYIYYAEWYDPETKKYHGKVPERAITTDSNNDGVSDLVYWLFGEDAKITKK